jgi:FKBP-type peptidyl-prolyl cis-trans isomerase
VKPGEGPKAKLGDRVVVHYECKWKGITFVTSRQGVGVTGGEPYGFDLGATGNTKALKGLDLGVQGMQKGGLRKLIVPPALGYGDRGARCDLDLNCTLLLPWGEFVQYLVLWGISGPLALCCAVKH